MTPEVFVVVGKIKYRHVAEIECRAARIDRLTGNNRHLLRANPVVRIRRIVRGEGNIRADVRFGVWISHETFARSEERWLARSKNRAVHHARLEIVTQRLAPPDLSAFA